MASSLVYSIHFTWIWLARNWVGLSLVAFWCPRHKIPKSSQYHNLFGHRSHSFCWNTYIQNSRISPKNPHSRRISGSHHPGHLPGQVHRLASLVFWLGWNWRWLFWSTLDYFLFLIPWRSGFFGCWRQFKSRSIFLHQRQGLWHGILR